MNILFYTVLFLIGIVVGNFWAKASVNMPKNLDLKKVHHSKYKNEDLVSKITYLFIGGLMSVVLANIFSIQVEEINITKIIIYIFSMLYISTVLLIGGIDRCYVKIEKRVLSFGIISSSIYMIYLSIIDLASLRISAIYLAIYISLLIIDAFLLRRYANDSYIVNILILLNIILVYTDLRTVTYTAVMAVVGIFTYVFMQNINKAKNGNKKIKINEIPIGYFISASNIVVLLMIRVFENYYI